jgi:drug/metabolite transporter (DMT)-like permease
MAYSNRSTALAVAGIFQFVLCSGFATFGVSYVGAGRTAVLIYTMQLWALPLGWLVAGERITRIAMVGGVTVFSGLLLFMNPMLVNWHDHKVVLGNALVLISAMCWALGACLHRRYEWQTPFWSQLFWQIFWSAVVATMAVPAFGPHRPVVWNIALIGVLAYNWLGTTVFCFFLWTKVLLVMQASTAGQFMSLIPVLALLSSAAINGEPVTPSGVVSVVLIVAGIYLAARGNRVLAD